MARIVRSTERREVPDKPGPFVTLALTEWFEGPLNWGEFWKKLKTRDQLLNGLTCTIEKGSNFYLSEKVFRHVVCISRLFLSDGQRMDK